MSNEEDIEIYASKLTLETMIKKSALEGESVSGFALAFPAAVQEHGALWGGLTKPNPVRSIDPNSEEGREYIKTLNLD